MDGQTDVEVGIDIQMQTKLKTLYKGDKTTNPGIIITTYTKLQF